MRAFKRLLQRLSRWAVAITLLPLLYVLLTQLFYMVGRVASEGFKSWWLYVAGAAAYLAFERMLPRPMWLYVVGHELTHAVSGLLSGAKIHSIKASHKEGEVRLSKSNAFIALSPYVLPFYSGLVLILYAIAKSIWPPATILPTFQVLLGATLAFHFSLTLSALHRQQSDLRVVGFFLSGMIIAVGNALILGILAVSLFTKTPTLRNYLVETGRETTMIWMKGIRCASLVKRFNPPAEKAGPPAAKHTLKDKKKWTR
jgi:hypothetical protein